MATTHLIPVGEYLGSTYRPDMEFIDGHLEERNLGDFDHADIQLALGSFLRVRQKDWAVRVLTEVRIQVAPTRFRIPDLCVLPETTPRTPVVTDPPLLCIEILSPRDTVAAMRLRVQDFLDMGVPAVWILDPQTRTAYICAGPEMSEHHHGTLHLPGTPILVEVAEIFSTLDA